MGSPNSLLVQFENNHVGLVSVQHKLNSNLYFLSRVREWEPEGSCFFGLCVLIISIITSRRALSTIGPALNSKAALFYQDQRPCLVRERELVVKVIIDRYDIKYK